MPRNVVFVAPFPAEATMRFVHAVKKLDDVKLLGVVHTPPGVVGLYDDLVRVTEPTSQQDILDGIEVLRRRHGEPFKIVGILETLMVELAVAREKFGVRGTPAKTAVLFREKAQMKDALRAAGLPVARHRLVTELSQAREFAGQVGLPLILKPPAGMGAKATFRVTSDEMLSNALNGMRVGPNNPLLLEEMLRGSEHSFETIVIDGKPQVWSIGNYQPGCLEVLENPWIQWAVVLPREVNHPKFEEARAMGFKAIKALGLDYGMTHMEWFARDDGSLAIGEIAQRPPGGQLLHMTGVVNDVDIYRAWARAMIDGVLDKPWNRKFAAGTAYLRGMGRGRVSSVRGIREINEAIGKHVVEAKLPTIGRPKNDSYEGDGYVMVKHERTDEVQKMIKLIVETVRIQYAG